MGKDENVIQPANLGDLLKLDELCMKCLFSVLLPILSEPLCQKISLVV